jgi:alpha-amylase
LLWNLKKDFYDFSGIYKDVAFNHMTAYNDNAIGVGGTTAHTYNKIYPVVPFGPEHFHPTCDITNYQDPYNVSDTDF